MKPVLVAVVLLGCKAEASNPPPAVPPTQPPPSLGTVADATATEPAPGIEVGRFVLLRAGTPLHTAPMDSSPSLLLSQPRKDRADPIAARVLGASGGFLEVETLGDDARSHCGLPTHWTDQFTFRGFVPGAALGQVTSAAWRFSIDGEAFELPLGVWVEPSAGQTTVEVASLRLVVNGPPPSSAGLSYGEPPRASGDCFLGQFEALFAKTRAVEVADDGTIGLGNVGLIGRGRRPLTLSGPSPVYLTSGERIGMSSGRIQVAPGKSAAATDGPPRTCVDVRTGESPPTSLCVQTDVVVTLPSVPVPRVRQAKASVKGALDRDIIRRIVRAHINEVRFCYNKGLKKDPSLAGRVAIDFAIGPDGMVQSASVQKTTLPTADVGTCIAEAVKRWRFPKPTGGAVVSVTYPFVLEPG